MLAKSANCLNRQDVHNRHRRSENSPAITKNSAAKFRSFPERALVFHNNSPVTLHSSPTITILNENPGTYLKVVWAVNLHLIR